jgi:hypothetical protein
MREITGQLTQELSSHYGSNVPAKAQAFEISSFKSLVHHVARLSCLNKDHFLLYRGQNNDYLNKTNSSTFYPTIYRGERITKDELELRINALESASSSLTDLLIQEEIEGAAEAKRRKYVQWSILQHYEVCPTPLVDFTQSLRVACSFALDKATSEPYVYVFALPYLTNRVSVNSEHDLVNIRLLSICPPDALRPYYQEGYLAGTDEAVNEYESKSDLDFNRRLIAKFRIGRGRKFWGTGFDPIPRSALYPARDKIEKICRQIAAPTGSTTSADIGNFLKEWSHLESFLLSQARSDQKRVMNTVDAISVIQSKGFLDSHIIENLNKLRILRNKVVHNPLQQGSSELKSATHELRLLTSKIQSAFDYISIAP